MAKIINNYSQEPPLNFISLGDVLYDTKHKEFYLVVRVDEWEFNIVNLATGNRFTEGQTGIYKLVESLNERHPDRFVKVENSTLTVSNE